MDVKVSIIVPVYNGEIYIEKCINSLRNQTLKECEFIFINDGSTDNTKYILEKYQKLDNRIRVIDKENEGVSVARNTGISCAKGEYIGFVDSDDWVENCMFEKLYNESKKFNSDVTVSGYKEVKKNNVVKHETFIKNKKSIEGKSIKKELVKSILKYNISTIVVMWNKIYKRELIKKYKISLQEDKSIGEDRVFNFSVLLKAQKVCFINEPLYNYNKLNENSATTKYNQDTVKIYLEEKKDILSFVKSNNAYNYNIESFINKHHELIFYQIIWYVKLNFKLKQSYFEKYKSMKILLSNEEFVDAYKNLNTNNISIASKIIVLFLNNKLYLLLYFTFIIQCLYVNYKEIKR